MDVKLMVMRMYHRHISDLEFRDQSFNLNGICDGIDESCV